MKISFNGKRLLSGMLICAVLSLAGCAGGEAEELTKTVSAEPPDTLESSATFEAESLSASIFNESDFFSERDLSGSYDAGEAEEISLDKMSSSSDKVLFADGTVTITGKGVYLLTGSMEGQVIIDAEDDAKVQLVLNGADISSASSAAIYALNADKVFITLANGSENSLSNGGVYTQIDDNNIDAVIFAKTDLTLNGSGTLNIDAAAGHGIVSKDELVICGGEYSIEAAQHGLCGKESIAISAGSFTINASGDGIHADNSEDATQGQLYITGGDFTIDADGDAISFSGSGEILGGSFVLTSGGGSATVTLTSDAYGFMGKGASAESAADASSCKGIKGDGSLSIKGGSFNIDTADDAIHAGGEVSIEDGDFELQSGDDAIHADSSVVISGGSFNIPYCYEGIEGTTVTISGGIFDIVSSDDGINAAGGADGSGTGARADQFAANGNCWINVSGGEITIVSDGDSMDSNGDINLTGGTINLSCNGNGNTAIDCNGSFTNSGAELSTNDGSENGTGMFGGGMGQHGGMRPDGSGNMHEGFGGDRTQKPNYHMKDAGIGSGTDSTATA